MVGSLGACGRVAAVALLAAGTVVPHAGPVRTATAPAPVVGVVTSCSVTVGTATTDPARAADAVRALAAGYALTDCMPDASLLAAAEARATIPLPGSSAEGGAVAGGAVSGGAVSGGAVSGGAVSGHAEVSASSRSAGQGTATAASVATTAAPATSASPSTTSAAPTTAATTAAPSSTDTTTTSSSGTFPGGGGTSGSSSGPEDGADGGADAGSEAGSDQEGTTTGPTTGGTVADGTTTAASRFGWGRAARAEDFDGDLSAWGVYDGPGHAGKGRRSPAAMSVANGVVTISGDAAGTTGGMAWGGGEKYGRWEARVRSPVADPTYNAVMLLWPDAENFPVGGEIDFMEIGDETRQRTDFFLHYGEEDDQLHGQVAIDATQWHNWAVEWAPDHITAYVDGQEWYTTTRTDAFPPGPMHLTLQLDWFPKGGGAVAPSTMSADWVRYYPIDGSGVSAAITNSGDGGPAAGSTSVGPQAVDTGSTGDTEADTDTDDAAADADAPADGDAGTDAGLTATSTAASGTASAAATAAPTTTPTTTEAPVTATADSPEPDGSGPVR